MDPLSRPLHWLPRRVVIGEFDKFNGWKRAVTSVCLGRRRGGWFSRGSFRHTCRKVSAPVVLVKEVVVTASAAVPPPWPSN